MSVRRPQGRRPPPCRDVEQRRIASTISNIVRDINGFIKAHMSWDHRSVNYQDVVECLGQIYTSWKIDATELATWNNFLDKQHESSINKTTKRTTSYEHLGWICRRAEAFERLVPDIRARLVNCLENHVFKYCRSFAELSEGVDARPILDYEEMINTLKNTVDEKLDTIKSLIPEYGNIKSPFIEFVRKGDTHESIMERILKEFTDICDDVSKWMNHDVVYPDKLWQEILFIRSYNEKLIDDIRKLHSSRKSYQLELENKCQHRQHLDEHHQKIKREKRKLIRSLKTIHELLSRSVNNLDDKEYEIGALESETDPSNPDRSSYDTLYMLQSSRKDLSLLQSRRTSFKKQSERHNRAIHGVSVKIKSIQKRIAANEETQEDIRQKLLGVDLEVKSIKERVDIIEKKTKVLNEVREVTLSPDTLRRIYYNRGHGQSKDQTISDVCTYISEAIGWDWPKLYTSLKFYPAREVDKLKQDIHIIQMISAKYDKTVAEQAKQSLAKWRNFNRKSNVSQLIAALRTINKADLANKVESRFQVDKDTHK